MQRIAINRDNLRAILGRDIMEEATLHSFQDGTQAYVRPLTPADMALGQQHAKKPGATEPDNTRTALVIGMLVVVDEVGKPIYPLTDLAVLLKSPRGQELVMIANKLMTESAAMGNSSSSQTEETPTPEAGTQQT